MYVTLFIYIYTEARAQTEVRKSLDRGTEIFRSIENLPIENLPIEKSFERKSFERKSSNENLQNFE